jgi:predicted nicotinamide N-methyase
MELAVSSHVDHVAGVRVFRNKHPVIKRLRKILPYPTIHGHKIWSSSYLIMDYLMDHPPAKGSRVMEVGCGWGLLSVFCASQFKAKVTGVDADDNVLPYLDVMAILNGVKVKTRKDYFQKIPRKVLAKQRLIVGSDICFWDNLVPPLYKLIKRAVKSGVETIIIADPGRAPFMALTKKCEKKYNAKLLPYTVTWPKEASGYLLVINS